MEQSQGFSFALLDPLDPFSMGCSRSLAHKGGPKGRETAEHADVRAVCIWCGHRYTDGATNYTTLTCPSALAIRPPSGNARFSLFDLIPFRYKPIGTLLESCGVKTDCGGFFTWATKLHSSHIHAIAAPQIPFSVELGTPAP